jgi:hypothetical protein
MQALAGLHVEDILISFLYIRKNSKYLKQLAQLDLDDPTHITPPKPRRRKLNVTANSKPLFPIRSSKSGKARTIQPVIRAGTKPLGF